MALWELADDPVEPSIRLLTSEHPTAGLRSADFIELAGYPSEPGGTRAMLPALQRP